MNVISDVQSRWKWAAVAAMLALLCAACYIAGMLHVRGQLRSFQAELAQHPTNSFTKCLHDSWVESGELQASGAKWMLVK